MNNEEKNFQKTSINWYPGHMAKTKRLISEELKNIDIVYELVDARIPYSSKIKDIDKIIKNKNRILIMTKKDLCDLELTNKWIKYYEELGYTVILADLKNSNDYLNIVKETKKITQYIQDNRIKKGLKEKEIRAMVIGIPNTGKSSLINKMTGKNVAGVENRPGVTKSLTYLKTNLGITILDTPGILWPKLDDEIGALNIACTGGIKKEVLNIDEICVHILTYLEKNYKNILKDRYKLEKFDIMEMYDFIGKSIGAIKNNKIDYEKVSYKVYNDVVSGNIKGVTFDEWKS